MRIVCFVLSVLCLLGAGVWLVVGVVNFGDTRSSSPTSSNFAMAQETSDTSPNLDDFGVDSTLAQVFAIAGVAWMIGAVAFAPKQTATAAATPQQWQQPQQFPAQPQYPQQQSAQHPGQQGDRPHPTGH